MKTLLKRLLPTPARAALSDWNLSRQAQRPEFQRIGQATMAQLIALGGLKPTDRVLEVGCGYGRIALPLTEFLAPSGLYRGIDIIAGEIRWAQNHITRHFPHFQFAHADVHNTYYNPESRQRASDYTFPFADNAFDFVFLTSVFTHMLRPDFERYLSEVTRVLTPGGRCFISYFLLRDDIDDAVLSSHFPHEMPGVCVRDLERPEWETAFWESEVRRLYAENGLTIEEPIRYGAWSGRPSSDGFQDVILAVKL